METISYQLTTLSSLIVSPRSALAFYKDLKEFKAIGNASKHLDKNKLKIIYPFYQYGIYEVYDPDTAEYYLPGSSIKGALCQGTVITGNLTVDDILIPKSQIILRNIYKAQYLDDNKMACFKEFFVHVGVEMIRAESVLTGSFNLDDFDSAISLVKAANTASKTKMSQMRKYLCKLIEKGYSDEGLSVCLQKAYNNISALLSNEQVLLLGGYKGLLHSMEVQESQREMAGAVYLDPETTLPHGLVKIELNIGNKG